MGLHSRPSNVRAVALRYAREQGRAPSVVAKGRAAVAERILELARERGIPVRQDRDLVELLLACDLGEEIPAELYGAIAELIAYLYRVNGELGATRT